jgi:hypothetical protein
VWGSNGHVIKPGGSASRPNPRILPPRRRFAKGRGGSADTSDPPLQSPEPSAHECAPSPCRKDAAAARPFGADLEGDDYDTHLRLMILTVTTNFPLLSEGESSLQVKKRRPVCRAVISVPV